ncbi:uncharacterized protein N7458_003879 [Penicillium daleae]|uniref:Uncharacterized protein n=1 Tax=Penicillium daleae TaxID=63821 RepID=A0AAD6CBR2_9EURO|nr:uncharacterized protein N7458_003879 [Penicillium daleae]KAJ5455615.1 hypothetical protein N7458_003879 [Penicillium daleae]
METPVLNETLVHQLLQVNNPNPYLEENSGRSWASFPQPAWSGPLLRISTESKASQPDESNRMVARASRSPLSTREGRGEYLCLWEVTPDEVVGHWDWEDLVDDPDWFGNVVMPAFVEHNYRFLGELSGQGDRDLANFLDALTVECASLISDEEDVEDSVDEDEDEDALTPTGVWDIENDSWWATYPGVEESNVLFHPVTSSRIVW